MTNPKLRSALLLGTCACAGVNTPTSAPSVANHTVGLIVMAHGGGPDWNEAIEETVAPLNRQIPTAVAFGMADAAALESALDSLTDLGVTRIALVRLFVSGESFLDRTATLLGLHAPGRISNTTDGQLKPIQHSLEVATHRYGLSAWSGIGPLLAQRALEVADRAGEQSVLILAHGAGDDEENTGLLARMRYAASAVESAGFAETHVATLREDWPEARVAAEAEARGFVREQAATGRSVIVLPFRISGFGPYADVLGGLSYVRGESFLPHPAITEWISQTASNIICGNGWSSAFTDCQSEYLVTEGT